MIFGLDYVNYNRSYKNTQILKEKKIKPSSYILGNSRSLAVTCADWINYLNPSEIPFHFDGSKENIYQIRKKLEYLTKKDYAINNVIAIVDFESLNNYSNSGHIYQLHYDISGEKINFHLNEIKPFLNLKYLSSLFLYSFTKKYSRFMRGYIVKNKIFSEGKFNDLFFLNELKIKSDSIAYYDSVDAKNMFRIKSYSKLQYPNKLKTELKKIKQIVNENKINFKLVIVTPYKINELGEDYLSLIKGIFSINEIYDFSSLDYKYHKGNFHEASHFRRKIGKLILKKIYE